ncbi:MAG TPA: shikimate kinase, partial [Clostridiales bacterium]|nr:shikimate kinase [Clostridiales bacterium]
MRYGLIGEKLSHSYSKTVHALLGDDSYELVSLRPEELAGFLRSRAFEGLNVTIPYKKAVIPFCAELSETARKTGSVNTIAVDAAGRLIGHNTDYAGFLYMAARAGIGFKGKNVLVLGSGGTGVTAVQAASDR